jgi:hypothetical protein
VSEALADYGFPMTVESGHRLWELISLDAQAGWLLGPVEKDGVIINVINVANHMAKSQCYIDFD